MTDILSFAAIGLALSLVLGLIRVFKGPSVDDRMMSAQLVGTTGVGMLLLWDVPSSLDVALVLALLAAVSVAALTRREGLVERNDD